MKSKPFISVSTKTGDQGESSLADGQRVSKDHPLFDVVGTLDELNSWLGLVVVKLDAGFPEHQQFLLTVQHNLFYIGAEVALSPQTKFNRESLTKLEKISENLQKSLQADWYQKFLLPGGTETGAVLDIARTVCRRCERVLVKADQEGCQIRPVIFKYLNRLSDYLFVLRCFVNHSLEYQEKQWRPI